MSFNRNILKKYNDLPVTAKATLWFMIASIIQKSISVVTTPIFTRLMSREQYGQFTIYNSWLQIFTIVCTMRLNWSVFNKGMSKFMDGRDNYTSTMQTITLCMSSGLLVIYLLFQRQINAITELPTFIMVAMFVELMLTPAIDFWTVRKRYEYQYRVVVVRTVLMALLNALVGVAAVLVFVEKGYARILSCVVVNSVFGIILFIYNYRRSDRFFEGKYAKFALLFNLPLLLHYFSQYILDQFDKIMIQKMVSFDAAALYGVAYSAGLLMKIVTNSINQSMIPWQYGKLENKEIKKTDDMLFLLLVFIGVVSTLFSAVAPELMMIFAGSKYKESVYVIPPVAVSMYFLFAYTSFANIEFYYDLNHFTMFISMGGAVLNIVLNYFCIKKFGYIAAAYTTLLCYIIFSYSHYVYMALGVRRKTGINIMGSMKRLTVLSTIVTGTGIMMVLLYDRILIRYILIAIILTVLFIKRDYVLSTLKTLRKKNDYVGYK